MAIVLWGVRESSVVVLGASNTQFLNTEPHNETYMREVWIALVVSMRHVPTRQRGIANPHVAS